MKMIMVVDDSPIVRQELRIALTQAGYGVVEAVDGHDALQKISTLSISLIICDMKMPQMNGLEMVEKLKSNPEYSSLPVVMLTSEGQPALIDRAKKVGARGWIIKPFKTDLLIAAVKKLVSVQVEGFETKAVSSGSSDS